MSKISDRRKNRQARELAGQVISNQDKFSADWHEKMDSWLHEIHRRTAAMVDSEGRTLPPAFGVVEMARSALKKAGLDETALKEHDSIDMLSHECCRALSPLIGGSLPHHKEVIYKVHQIYEAHGKYRVARKNRGT